MATKLLAQAKVSCQNDSLAAELSQCQAHLREALAMQEEAQSKVAQLNEMMASETDQRL